MHEKPRRALIFVNGEIENLAPVSAFILINDVLIAADGGLRYIRALGLTPALLIGDLDSVEQVDVDNLSQAGVPILKYPVDKNETDLELALLWAVDQGFQSIRIVGGLGGRLDQTLANIFLLTQPRFTNVDIRIDDGSVEAYLIHETGQVDGQIGDTVSLLPLGEDAYGVNTLNLKYPLRNEILYAYRSRGVSNVLTSNHAQVSLTRGTLLCVHIRQTGS